MRILLADDEALCRRLVRNPLEAAGHDVVEARDGAEAWRLLHSDRFHLAIIDWQMPGMSGIDIVRKVRGGAVQPAPYIILLTGMNRRDEVMVGLEAGVDDYVVKPVDASTVRARVQLAARILRLRKCLVGQAPEPEAVTDGPRPDAPPEESRPQPQPIDPPGGTSVNLPDAVVDGRKM